MKLMPSGCGPSQQFMRITRGEAAGLTIGLIPKAGLTSIRDAIWPDYAEKVMRSEAKDKQTPVRIYIREPLCRLVSAFRFLLTNYRPRPVPAGCTFEQFIDLVLDPDRTNSHWRPQVAWFDEYNVTEIYQFERIADTWPDYIPLGHLNCSPASTPVPVLGYRLDEINAYYADDSCIWRNSA